MGGPLAAEQLLDPILRFYGIDLGQHIPTTIVTPALVLFAFLGVFCAGFLAWAEENDARIAAEKRTPQELQKEVRELADQMANTNKELAETKASQARTVSSAQWKAIREILTAAAQKGEPLFLSIKVAYGDIEAEKYAKDFMQIFSCEISYDSKIGPDLVGLVIRVKDPKLLPTTATYLAEALKAADLHYKIDPLDYLQFPIDNDSGVELVIGSKG